MIDYKLVILSAIVLLPLIPAYLLFKALPSSGTVEGPLAGLKVKLGGAFGGYVALTVFISVTFGGDLLHPAYRTWRVQGTLRFAQGELPGDVACSISPEQLPVTLDTFDFSIPIIEGKEPTLYFKAPGYVPLVVPLAPDAPTGGRFSIKRDAAAARLIFQQPIAMEKKAAMPQYGAAATTVQPVSTGG
jgi:hypothetical protein